MSPALAGGIFTTESPRKPCPCGCCSVTQSCLTLCDLLPPCPSAPPPWIVACQASQSFTISWSLLKLMSIESVMPFNHLVLCRPLLLLPSIFPRIKVFSNESALCIRWPKYWNFSFSISPSNEYWIDWIEYSGLISFRIDWFDLAIQKTLKSLLQHHSSKHQSFGTQPTFLLLLVAGLLGSLDGAVSAQAPGHI